MTTPTIAGWPADPACRPTDCTGCRGTCDWGVYRLIASAMVGPHPVVLDMRCPTCRVGVGEVCRAKRTPLHAARADRYITAHEWWGLLTANVADAAYRRAHGEAAGGALRLAAARTEELARLLRPAGLTYRVPALDDVIAAASTVALFPTHRRVA